MIATRLENPDRATRWLNPAAMSAPLIGLVVAILAVTSHGMESASISTKAVAFLSPLIEGLFAAGVIAGFGGFVSAPRRPIAAIIRFLGLSVFITGIIVAGLMTKEMGGYNSGGDKALTFLTVFVRIAVLYGGILVGFAALNSPALASVEDDPKLVPGTIYLAAVAAFAIGLAMAGLTVSEMSGYASGSEKAAAFLRVLLETSVLYGGILAGFGAMVSSRAAGRTAG